jgi:phosphate transport system protein
MRFRSLLSLFRDENWADSMIKMLDEMLELSTGMFDYTTGILIHGRQNTDPDGKVWQPDKQINALMWQIRRRLVSRLSIGGHQGEVPTALILMNAVKDAERIGDYIKNIYDAFELMPDHPDRALYAGWLEDRARHIMDLFMRTRQAFTSSDDEEAARVIADARKLGRECEAAIVDITRGEITAHDAVCIVLVLRFFKRIAAHQSNIATTVVMPVDLLDFHDEGPR